MRELIFGTTNPAKLKQVREALQGVDVEIRGMQDFDVGFDVEETGATVQENARLKALAYAAAIGKPVLSLDNALYFEGVRAEEQPGIYVRRVGGSERATDTEMLAHYSALVRSYGGALRAYWEFGHAFATPEGAVQETTFRSHRQFIATPSTVVRAGYPLESLQVDPVSGKIVSEMSDDESAVFWQREIGAPIRAFIERIMETV